MVSSLVQMQLANRQLRSGKKIKLRKPPRWLYPNSIEREYRSTLTKFISVFKQITAQILIPRLPSLIESANLLKPKLDSARSDDWLDEANEILLRIEAEMALQKAKLLNKVQDTAVKASDWNIIQFQKTVNQVYGVDVFTSEPWLKTELDAFIRQNSKLVSGLVDQTSNQIDGIITRGVQQGIHSTQLAQEIMDRFGVAESRAKIIARDQTSKLNSQLTQLRQKSVGIKKYRWVTAGDERVRPSHQALNGKVFSWNDPPSEGNPGESLLCRCIAQPIFEED